MTRELDEILKELEQIKEKKLNRALERSRDLGPRLAQQGVVVAEAHYEGSGDSGQIETITFMGAEGKELIIQDDLEKAFEELAYGYLESRHLGWENDEGGFGLVTFDVRAQKLTVGHTDWTEEIDDDEDSLGL